jgi:ribokinase
MAMIEVSPQGENRIVVSPGANASLVPADLERFPHIWDGVKIFLTQMETSLPSVFTALNMAKKHDVLTVLNPAPAPSDPPSSRLLGLVDFLVPNEWEAQALSGIRLKKDSDLPQMAKRLLDQGVGNVVVTRGPQGLFFKNPHEEIWMKAFKVKAIDTTAAGDAFVAALACGLAAGKPWREVLRWANGAGALAATTLGAQPSLPRRKDLQRFLARHSSP